MRYTLFPFGGKGDIPVFCCDGIWSYRIFVLANKRQLSVFVCFFPLAQIMLHLCAPGLFLLPLSAHYFFFCALSLAWKGQNCHKVQVTTVPTMSSKLMRGQNLWVTVPSVVFFLFLPSCICRFAATSLSAFAVWNKPCHHDLLLTSEMQPPDRSVFDLIDFSDVCVCLRYETLCFPFAPQLNRV